MEDQAQPTEQTDAPILFGTDAWIEHLKDKPIPVRASSVQRLRIMLSKDSTMLHHLSALVRSDPVLCLHVVRAAEKLHADKPSYVTSIDHAVQSLGIDPLTALARSLTPIKLNPASVQQKQYLRTVANSHHAAFQAKTWMKMKRLPFVEEVYLASLFYSIGLWMLWLHAPLHMHKVQIKIREEGVDPTLAEHDVLGCTMQKISMGLSREWGLSELTLLAQDPETSPPKAILAKLHQRALGDPRLSQQEIRELNHLTQERFFPVKIANWLALSVSRGWQSSRNIQTTDIISDYLGLEPHPTLALLHKLCADASRDYHAPGTLAPAAEMLMLPSTLMGNYKLGPKELALLEASFPKPERPKPKPKKAKPAPTADTVSVEQLPDTFATQAIYSQVAERFLKGYHLYTKPAHILQGLVQGIAQGLGLPRVVLNLVNTKTHSMKAAQVIGLEPDAPMATYQIDLQIPSLFKKLCDKPGCVWITDENRAKYRKMLPEDYQTLLPDHDCLLMSIFRGSQPIAIIYADGGEHGLPLSAFHQDRFKYLCSAATLALKRMLKP